MIPSQSQTLITGVYRTGSEYLTQLLNLHPRLSASMYRVNVLRFVYDRYRPIRLAEVQRAALESINERFEQRYDESLPVRGILDELRSHDNVDYGLFYDVIMSTLYLDEERDHWAEKNQLLWRQIPLFIDMMRNGRAILIIRDPRAVLASFKKYTTADPPGYLGAVFNCYDSMKWAVTLGETLAPDHLLVMRYEDLATRPHEEIPRAWKFIGLPGPYPDVSQRGTWKDAYGNPWHANSSFQSDDPKVAFDVDKAISGWREALSEGEVSLAEIVNAELMPSFGYEMSLSAPSWSKALKLFGHDQITWSYFQRWLDRGEGIQAFPANPLDPSTWENARQK